MTVLAVLNQKGGVGKTTIAMNLARAFQLQGKSVLLVEADEQGSSRNWSAVREDFPITVVGIYTPTLERDLKNLGQHDLIIIDGKPEADGVMSISAIKAADAVLIPVQPSPLDVWSGFDVAKMVRTRMEVTSRQLKAAVMVSRAIPGTRLAKDVLSALDDYQLPIFTSRTTQKVDYSHAVGEGKTVMDGRRRKGPAGKEIQAIADEVMATLL